MNIKFRNYENDMRFGTDYYNVCNFLKRINQSKMITPNFLWARWVWMISRPVDNENLKNKISLWEDDDKIVGLATYEDTFGEIFICVDSDYEFLKQEILSYAKNNLSSDGMLKVMISDSDSNFQSLALECGFQSTQEKQTVSVIEIGDELIYQLPEGFRIVSMEDDWDFLQYNRIMWRGFDHDGEAPQDEEEIKWRRTMLSSPHLEPNLTIAIVSPNGNYVAHCGLWFNVGDNYAYVEPVVTDPEYRHMGLGKAVVYETLLRAKKNGAKEAYVVSSQQFYYNIGFKPYATETWWEFQPVNEKIIKWIVDRIKEDYPEDIAMLLIYGSYVNGTANALSDVDFYFIPKTDRGNEMSKTFIVNGIGYDLFPLSWERLECITEFKEPLTPLIGNVRIEYSNSEHDLKRFVHLQEKLHKNLSDTKFMYDIATKNIENAMSKYTKLMLTSNNKKIRVIAGEILLLLSDSVAYMNQTYFNYGIKKQLSDLEKMQPLPNNYIELYKKVVAAKSIEAVLKYTLEIIKQTHLMNENLKEGAKRRESINYQEVQSIYEELLSTFNKVKMCCEQGNCELAFMSGINLQSVLDWLAEDFNMPEFDLISSYDSQDLNGFDKKAEAIRIELVEFLESKSVEIKDYKTFEEFKGATYAN